MTGVGGVGKSRTALELASTQLASTQLTSYPGGCWLVELSAVRDAELVTPAIATVLGVHEHPDRQLIDQFGGASADGQDPARTRQL